MPRVVIPKKDLPPISAQDDGYNIRLRLVSQDRNRSSFWTPLYSIAAQASASVTGIVHIVNTGSGKVIDLIWGDPQSDREYDIYMCWNPPVSPQPSDWTYIATTTLNNYRVVPPGTATDFIARLQISTYPKGYSANHLLYESAETNL